MSSGREQTVAGTRLRLPVPPGLTGMVDQAVAAGRVTIPAAVWKNGTDHEKRPLVTWKGRVEAEVPRTWPGAYLWAYLTGGPYGLVVLDFDGDDGAALLARSGLTAHRRTGSGGFHVEVDHPGWHVKTCTKVLPGLDVRGDGGIAYFAGVSHWGTYETLESHPPYPPSALPDWLAEAAGLARPPAPPPPRRKTNGSQGPAAASSLTGWCRWVRQAPDGTSNERFHRAVYAVAGMCAAGVLDPDAAEDELLAAAEERGVGDAAAVFASSWAAGESSPWEPEEGEEVSDQEKTPPADLLAKVRNGTWLDRQTFPPLRYHVPRVIPEGSILLVGAPKVGKSWLVLGMGLGVAHGGYVLGKVKVEPRPVFYLALEDGERRLQDRCRRLLSPGEAIPEAFDYLTMVAPGTVLDTIDAWLARHAGAEPLVIFDTLGKVMPPALLGESPYQRDYRISSALKALVDEYPGAALLTNHHDRKAGADDFVDSVSGTHGLAGAADTILVLVRRRHETVGLLKVTGRDVVEGEYALTFIDALWQLDGSSFDEAAKIAATRRATIGVGDQMAQVIDFVTKKPAGVGPKQASEALGIPYDRATTYLARAVETGRLFRPRRGLYTPVRSVGSVSSEAGNSRTDTSHTPLEEEEGDDAGFVDLVDEIIEVDV